LTRHWMVVPRNRLPECPVPDDALPLRIYVSAEFMVHVFPAKPPAECCLSVHRMEKIGDRFRDGIAWEELQSIKDQLGFADRDAVEIYPAATDVVNNNNIRHLWLMAAPIPFAWRAGDAASAKTLSEFLERRAEDQAAADG
jgi:hypothetical protein